ncbi:hypothetical protein TGDOM2_297900 [Toxoplasma gondii GAB2-2007-GAL-DOM2]|uniref:Uncharacterized protein n=7 Tax=Toxoplasma gondii TaxID=5811 RepID=B9Q180_TOXGV|nr:hypothetical protein TGGT1_297900 [Toxoplasma gondii GT1]ESS29927.1 hypothetical protein TGVEG_297900 [Toxoplasma gondii VEG]KAF4645782.1 hypothetical protein TGRH88_002680 [Toxoplasma gondii]KFG30119.1 hypothetical protein TGP89_297900 [Toxoplasma gondii p89]KFG40065.1 hypothetical protein TGFOU_297900 [Toxoplasma gondii FOU]KFG42005.1 hypothetical protein TGDOM2_297900 [Toxoplasma gondii GAB2-2007-GAL-DOM2]RQX67374.1 hypothetical protein TGCAST_297900 [Toxoplasma gondii CAST]
MRPVAPASPSGARLRGIGADAGLDNTSLSRRSGSSSFFFYVPCRVSQQHRCGDDVRFKTGDKPPLCAARRPASSALLLLLSVCFCLCLFTAIPTNTHSKASAHGPSDSPATKQPQVQRKPQNTSAFKHPIAKLYNRTMAAALAGPVPALRRVASSGNPVGSWGKLLCNSHVGEEEEVFVLFLGAGDAPAAKDSATVNLQENAGGNVEGVVNEREQTQTPRTDGRGERGPGRHARQHRSVQAAIDTVTLLYMLHCKLMRIVDLRDPSNSILLQHLQHIYSMRDWEEKKRREGARSETQGAVEAVTAKLTAPAASDDVAETLSQEDDAAELAKDDMEGEPILSVVNRTTGTERLFFGFREIRDFLLTRLVVKARLMAQEQQRESMRRAQLVTVQADPAAATKKGERVAHRAQGWIPKEMLPVGNPVSKHWWEPLGLSLDLYTPAASSKECSELQQIMNVLSETGFVDVVKVHKSDTPKADVPPVLRNAGLGVFPALGIGNRIIFGTEEIVRFLHALGSFIPTPARLRQALQALQPSRNDGAPPFLPAGEAPSVSTEGKDAGDKVADLWPAPRSSKTGESLALLLPVGLRGATLACNSANLAPCQRLLDWLSGLGLFEQVRKHFAVTRLPAQSDKTQLRKQLNEPFLITRGVVIARGAVEIQARIAAAYVAADSQSWTYTPVVAHAFLARSRPVTKAAEKIVATMRNKGLHSRVRMVILPNLQPLVVGRRTYPVPFVLVPGIAQFVGLNDVKTFFAALGYLVNSAV